MHFEANYYKGYGGYKGTIMPTPTPTPRTPTPLPWGVTPTPAIHYVHTKGRPIRQSTVTHAPTWRGEGPRNKVPNITISSCMDLDAG